MPHSSPRQMPPSTSQQQHQSTSASNSNDLTVHSANAPSRPLIPPSLLANRRLFMMDSSDSEELGHADMPVVHPALAAAAPIMAVASARHPVRQAIVEEKHYMEKFASELKCPLCR